MEGAQEETDEIKSRINMFKKTERNRRKVQLLQKKENMKAIQESESTSAKAANNFRCSTCFSYSWQCSDEKTHKLEWGEKVRRLLVKDAFKEQNKRENLNKPKKSGLKGKTLLNHWSFEDYEN